jgi:uncharacterized membrane protein YfcA
MTKFTGSKELFILMLASGVKSAKYMLPCDTDSICHNEFTSKYHCLNQVCSRVPYEYSQADYFGFFIAFMASMFSNAGGVGASMINVPILIWFLKFASSDAIPLSRVAILSGATINFIMNIGDREKDDPNKLLLDFALAATFMPLLLAGTQVGVMITRVLPTSIVGLLLVYYLISAAWKMYKKAKIETLKETHQMTELQTLIDKGHQIEDPSGEMSVELDSQEILVMEEIEGGHVDGRAKKKIPSAYLYKKQIPNILMLLVSFVILIFSTLVRGGENFDSIVGMVKCKLSSWVVFLGTQLTCICLSVLLYKLNWKQLVVLPGESPTSEKSTKRSLMLKEFVITSFLAGILAGVLGIGGGLVLGLFMVELGMDQNAITALSTFIVLCTSIISSVQFTVVGAIRLKHVWPLILAGAFGSIVGNLVLKALIIKYKRPSILFWVLVFVLVLASFLLPYEIIRKMVVAPNTIFEFGFLC